MFSGNNKGEVGKKFFISVNNSVNHSLVSDEILNTLFLF